MENSPNDHAVRLGERSLTTRPSLALALVLAWVLFQPWGRGLLFVDDRLWGDGLSCLRHLPAFHQLQDGVRVFRSSDAPVWLLPLRQQLEQAAG